MVWADSVPSATAILAYLEPINASGGRDFLFFALLNIQKKGTRAPEFARASLIANHAFLLNMLKSRGVFSVLEQPTFAIMHSCSLCVYL